MKVGIVGSGLVGATAAYALVMQGIGREIVLVDQNQARAEAEADDILHAVPFAAALLVRSGDYADLAGSRVVILSAGVGQRPGESRLELLERNAAVFGEIVPMVVEHAPQAVLVVATNPVDIMTHLAAGFAQEAGARPGQVLGTGTTLDTARFRALLGEAVGVDSRHVHAYVVGEHGDSEVLTWSLATVGGMPLLEFSQLQGVRMDQAFKESIDARVRRAAYHIIEAKGATYYGIGSALARITDAILHDRRAILTVCSPGPRVADVSDVTVSLPRLVGGDGVLATFPLPLDQLERATLQSSAGIVRQAIDELGSGQPRHARR